MTANANASNALLMRNMSNLPVEFRDLQTARKAPFRNGREAEVPGGSVRLAAIPIRASDNRAPMPHCVCRIVVRATIRGNRCGVALPLWA